MVMWKWQKAHLGKLYNSSALITAAGRIYEPYRKLHLFWDEKDLFDPGDRPPRSYGVDGTILGLMICFDWVFPEVARILALEGAEIICHSANLVLPLAHKAMSTRAIENSMFVVLANRVGEERLGDKTLKFNGGSRIIDTKGEVLIASDESTEEIRVMEIDPTEARDKMITPRNHLLDDRKPEMYGSLVRTKMPSRMHSDD